MSVTTTMRDYLSLVAEELIEEPDGTNDEFQRRQDAKDRLWRKMTEDEREYLNGLIDDVFGQWL